MKFSDKKYAELLKGIVVSKEMLEGRDYRPDKKKIFGRPKTGEKTWFKTLSLDLDQSCQEAYHVVGLRVDPEYRIVDVGVGVMYIGKGGGCGGCGGGFSISFGDEGDGDVDDKEIMDVLALSDMFAIKEIPFVIEHEIEMARKGRYVPSDFDPEGKPLPKRLVELLENQTDNKAEIRHHLLDQFNITLERDGDEGGFSCRFNTLSNRGRRYYDFTIYGSEGWIIDSSDIDCYLSFGNTYGNCFTKAVSIDENDEDLNQAYLALVDLYIDAEFQNIVKS